MTHVAYTEEKEPPHHRRIARIPKMAEYKDDSNSESRQESSQTTFVDRELSDVFQNSNIFQLSRDYYAQRGPSFQTILSREFSSLCNHPILCRILGELDLELPEAVQMKKRHLVTV
jgi:hypothetical protein